jgi:hypothetical protein
MFLCTSGGPCGSRYAQGSNNVPHLTMLNRPSSLRREMTVGWRASCHLHRTNLGVQTTPESDPVLSLPVRGCAARRWRPPADAGGAAATRRLGGFDRPLTGTPARHSATRAARERRAHHEQPAAGTSRSTKAGGEPRARPLRTPRSAAYLPSGLFSRELQNTDHRRAIDVSLHQGSKPDVRVPFFAPAVALLCDRKTTEPQRGNRHARDVSLSERPWPSPARPSTCGPRDANPVQVLRSRGHSAVPPTPG